MQQNLSFNKHPTSFILSNYKNTVIGKALIGISPHGMSIHFSDIYPGSISGSLKLLWKQVVWIMLILKER